MKLLCTSDWHLDAVTSGVRRRSEFDPYLDAVLNAIWDEEIDHVLVGGDYFDPGSMRAHELTSLLMKIAGRLAQSRARNVVFIAGNHDPVESSEGWTTLSPLREALKWGFCHDQPARLHVFEQTSIVTLDGRDGHDLTLLALPYMSRAVKVADLDYLGHARTQADGDGVPLVVLGHLTVPGAILGSESREMARGRDVELPSLADIKPDLVVNGHYHQAQEVAIPGGLQVIIPGSPSRFTFGERHDKDKGFTIVELGGGG